MASKGFTKPSTGQSFSERSDIQDLSALTEGSLAFGSMAGGNMTTAKGEFYGGQGTKSEQTSVNIAGEDLGAEPTVDPASHGVGNYRKVVK